MLFHEHVCQFQMCNLKLITIQTRLTLLSNQMGIKRVRTNIILSRIWSNTLLHDNVHLISINQSVNYRVHVFLVCFHGPTLSSTLSLPLLNSMAFMNPKHHLLLFQNSHPTWLSSLLLVSHLLHVIHRPKTY